MYVVLALHQPGCWWKLVALPISISTAEFFCCCHIVFWTCQQSKRVLFIYLQDINIMFIWSLHFFFIKYFKQTNTFVFKISFIYVPLWLVFIHWWVTRWSCKLPLTIVNSTFISFMIFRQVLKMIVICRLNLCFCSFLNILFAAYY